MADLRWLGLAWDEGPDVGGPSGPYRQSERLERHRAAAERAAGRRARLPLLLPGGAPRAAAPRGARRRAARRATTGAASRWRPTRCERRLAAGEPAAVRFQVPAGEVVVDDLIRGPVVIDADALSDPIIVRSDGVAGYNFATVVDDRDMGITHVIRGDDHLTNTARQQLLFEALGGPVPRFAHHSMVLGPDGGKLSKRHGATAVGDYRDLGYLPEAIVNYLALLGWSHGEDEVLEHGPARRRVRAREALAEPGGVRPRQARLARPRAHHGARAGGARAPLRGAAAGRDAAAGGGRARGRLPAVAGALRRRAGRRGGGARAAASAGGAARRRARGRPAARPRPRIACRGAGLAHARRRPRPPRRLPCLGQGARHRRPRPAHAAAHRAHLRRARARAALRARRARRETVLARLDHLLAGNAAGESTPTPGDEP